ncbi:MAG: hypothetical protein AAGB02_04705 [Pseudomonadota bacterium]
MNLQAILNIVFWPFKLVARLFRRGARAGGRETKGAARTAGGAVARLTSEELLDQEYKAEPPTGLEAALFRQLPRPRLTERSASDLTIEEARDFAGQAARFYEYEFPLFTRGDFFYEEIELEFLHGALGYGQESIDERFIDVTTLFRRTLNENTRRLFLYWTPFIGVLALTAAYFWSPTLPFLQTGSPWMAALAPFGIAAVFGGLFMFLVYSWPYKVVQQRNLMNLDNYVTSKFARINNNFQVAKRRALNVEREKRMNERDALKDEAGAWTLAYHWFASRLYLCETMLRNKFYQVRRNTTLYWIAGLGLTAACVLALGLFGLLTGADTLRLAGIVAGGTGYLFLAALTLIRAPGMMLQVLKANEWSRFHLVNLDRTIRDHVGEDKIQIVTFRDRNRFE